MKLILIEMLLKLDHPKLFSDIISIISDLVDEVRMKVNKEGVSILAIDPANVAMILFNLPSSAFSEFEVEDEEVLGVNLDNLKAVLRRIKPGSVLIISRIDNELKLEIKDRVNREFNLALVEIEGQEKEIPKLDFVAKVEMNSTDFSEAIEDCSVVSDSCSFITEPDKFMIRAKGSLNSFKSDFSSDEVNLQSEKATSRYSIEYLQKMIKAGKITDKVVLNFGDDYPLRLEFMTPFIQLSFILAPRVETDD